MIDPVLVFMLLPVAEVLQSITCEDIVCYGIGRFGNCFIACQQLALLLHIASAKEVRYFWCVRTVKYEDQHL